MRSITGKKSKSLLIAIILIVIPLIPWMWRLYSINEQHVHVIEIDPHSVDIHPVILDLKATRDLRFSQIVSDMHPYAAINGTFYGTDLKPLGDILVDGKLINKGRYTNAIAIKNDGSTEFVKRKGTKFDWRGYKCALAAGPRLVHDGRIRITPVADGFFHLNPDSAASRSGIGLTKSGKLLLVVYDVPVTLWKFAGIMRNLGAVEAMNLDGGPACGLYHDGKTIVDARLRMTNLLVVDKK